MVHRMTGMDTTWDAAEDDETPFCHLQGYTPRIHCFDRYRNRGNDTHRNRGGAEGRYGFHTPRPPPDKPQGWFTWPDQDRRAYKPGIQCDACKRIGHNAVYCDMLVITLYINRYTKDISATKRSTIESCWLDKYKAKLGQPALHARSCTPIAITTTLPPTTSTRLWTGNAGLIRIPMT